MGIKTEQYLDAILEKISFLKSHIQLSSITGQYKLNIAAENIVCELLNRIYGYELVNLNIHKKNHPGIDLGDLNNGIAVQVTSSRNREKVNRTLASFDKYEFIKQYNRLLIFVLSDRTIFSKSFATGELEFCAATDIIDFSTLIQQLSVSSEEVIESVYYYLENEITWPESHWTLRFHREIRWGACAALLLLMAWFLWNVGTYCYGLYRDSHPQYAYETNTDWLNMDEAAAILSNSSHVVVYKEDDQWEPNTYYSGVALTVLYNNLDEFERTITHFSVYTEDIVEDLSPRLHYYIRDTVMPITFILTNVGWGETGPIQVDYIGMEPTNYNNEELPVELSLREDAISAWQFDSIQPGQTVDLPLFSEQDLEVVYKSDFESPVWYSFQVALCAPETGYAMTLSWMLEVFPDHITVFFGGEGGQDEKNYVIWVPTSEHEWSESYTVYQRLPAKQTVRLPIFIIPEKSCTMTIRIEFETHDGEIIKATPLENARFIVPYYDDPEEYVDGHLLDWKNLNGDEIIFFPFASTPYVIQEE